MLRKKTKTHINTWPGFIFIGGAPRSGTTALFRYLSIHPQIAPSKPKETFYFMDKDHPLCNPKYHVHRYGFEAFYRFFKKSKLGAHYYLEGTSQYLYQKTALESFVNLNPLPKVIFILRDPVKRFISAYEYALYNVSAIPPSFTLEDYLAIAQGKPDKRLSPYLNTLIGYELDYGCYNRYVSQWFENYPKENLKIIIFEEMIQDPKNTVLDIVNWLNLEATIYDDYSFKKINPTLPTRYPGILYWGKKFFKGIPMASKIKGWLQQVLAKPSKKTYHKETVQWLSDYYKAPITQLKALLSYDLSLWG